ncbi:WUSCHEL-related homeobox 11-like [Impatiens glandulifera]|uniref:WUSCHEL-related homeobox 11-like n=1 Tax=Impatiens glandulifera TaxID=253017 RepID=UPI001FB06CEA|nr:WUSCHEL-related homeobox 11-like [Impatiens glandulifera]
MDDKNVQDHNGSERTEPVRSRWTPKPEQILILESIFNGGMVNPPKEETIRIRKLLEKFGSVGDANVFYWFQNRRSRSRRRQRQIQNEQQQKDKTLYFQSTIPYSGPTVGFGSSGSNLGFAGSSTTAAGGGNSCGFEDIYGYTGQIYLPEIEHNSGIQTLDSSNSQFHHHTGFITVFINGVQTEVPSGSIDMKSMFGENVVLIHSSGITVPFNEYGFLLHTLQHGESYFLVSYHS